MKVVLVLIAIVLAAGAAYGQGGGDSVRSYRCMAEQLVSQPGSGTSFLVFKRGDTVRGVLAADSVTLRVERGGIVYRFATAELVPLVAQASAVSVVPSGEGSRKLYTGPRGGKYYINEKGKR